MWNKKIKDKVKEGKRGIRAKRRTFQIIQVNKRRIGISKR